MSNTNNNALGRGMRLEGNDRVYTIEQVLGQGGFGITYKVSATVEVGNIEIDSSFTVKEHFLKEACERDGATSRVRCSAPVKERVDNSLTDFIAEARRLQQIKHPNIVKVSEVFETNDTAYYVMEYINGKSLSHHIDANGALDESKALEVITPILDAVNYLHQNRMTHLDIKPDNVMMREGKDANLTPVLIDFGLSKHYDENGKATSTVRTMGCSDGYAPPEQYAGIMTFIPQADVYSLGATLLYLLTGKQPEKSTDIDADAIAAMLPEGGSERVGNAIIHAMEINRKNRTASVSDFAKELGVKLTAVPSSVSGFGGKKPKKPKKKKENKDTEVIDPNKPARPRWVTPLLIGLGVLVVGVIAFFGFNAISDNDAPIDSADSTDSATVPTDTVAVPTELPAEVPVAPAVEVVDENVDDGYSVAYAGALNLYNSRKYADCKRECQKLLRQYTSREQKQQLTQLIEYCDTALAAEESAQQQSALEQQYQSDYTAAERLYNQKKYSECKSRCQSMLNSYPSHRSEINSLISKCDSAISAQQAAEQAAVSSRLPDKAVDLGLSVLWCDRNVGASSSSGNGNYYDFDEAGSAARSMGSGWRLPTKAELEELNSKCSWSWTGSGYKVTGPNGNSIYLPAAGWRYGSSTYGVGSDGGYWSSTPGDSDDAYYLGFYSGSHYVNWNDRSCGNSVRPVRAK